MVRKAPTAERQSGLKPTSSKNSSLFTLYPETPINRAFQGVKSYQRLFTHSSPLFTEARGFEAQEETQIRRNREVKSGEE